MRRWLFVVLFVSLAAAQEGDIGNFRRTQRRSLLKSDGKKVAKEQRREAQREKAAKEAFQREQKLKAKDEAAYINIAAATANDAIQQYLLGNSTERVNLLVHLLRNADGLAFKFTINTLLNRGDDESAFVKRNVDRAIGRAIKDGFATNTATAFAYAFTIQPNKNDHRNLLDILMSRVESVGRKRKSKGNGCLFVKYLLTDADLVAHGRGDSFAFVSAFETKEYLPLMECFLDECKGAVGRCCNDKKSLKKGLCGCHKKSSSRCDFNIFSNEPRTIWVCSKRECEETEKCMCPEKQ